jgi:NAD dependent epimerase/dehydratase family enzyme
VECETVRGPLNGAAPGAVRNAEFVRAIAGKLHRPAFLPVPAFLLKLLPGGFSDVFLHSQRLVPAAALAGGFTFLHPGLDSAADDVFATDLSK